LTTGPGTLYNSVWKTGQVLKLNTQNGHFLKQTAKQFGGTYQILISHARVLGSK
jgi:hypothetical protein